MMRKVLGSPFISHGPPFFPTSLPIVTHSALHWVNDPVRRRDWVPSLEDISHSHPFAWCPSKSTYKGGTCLQIPDYNSHPSHIQDTYQSPQTNQSNSITISMSVSIPSVNASLVMAVPSTAFGNSTATIWMVSGPNIPTVTTGSEASNSIPDGLVSSLMVRKGAYHRSEESAASAASAYSKLTKGPEATTSDTSKATTADSTTTTIHTGGANANAGLPVLIYVPMAAAAAFI